MQSFPKLGIALAVITASLSACQTDIFATNLFPFSGKSALTADISPVNRSYSGDQDVLVNVTLSNNTQEPITFLTWDLPKTELENDIFSVVRDGQELPFQGAMVNRENPMNDDYLTLKPGDQINALVNLSYSYSVNVSGNYTVELNPDAFDVSISEGNLKRTLTPEHVYSAKVDFWVEGYATEAEEKAARY